MNKKSRMIQTILSDEEYELAEELAQKEKVSLFQLIRTLIAREAIRKGYEEESETGTVRNGK